MRYPRHVTRQKKRNCSCFEDELGGNYEIDSIVVRLRNTKLEDELFRKGGGNVTVIAFHSISRGHVH